MDHTLVDEKSLKSLEDLAIHLTTGMLSLMTLQNIQVQALEIGIMQEDQAERANTIIWDIRRLIKLYKDQTESVLELLPDDFNHEAIIEKLKQIELTKARSMTRKTRVKKCDT
jgi:hypothetical protein